MERCALDSGLGCRLACDCKIVLNLAVPSGANGGELSFVAQVVEVEENDTQAMKTMRDPLLSPSTSPPPTPSMPSPTSV